LLSSSFLEAPTTRGDGIRRVRQGGDGEAPERGDGVGAENEENQAGKQQYIYFKKKTDKDEGEIPFEKGEQNKTEGGP